jgi:hypothetical protein
MSVEIPASSGYVVSMIEFQDHVIIACQFAVYRVHRDFDALANKNVDRLEVILEVPHPPIVVDRKDLE